MMFRLDVSDDVPTINDLVMKSTWYKSNVFHSFFSSVFVQQSFQEAKLPKVVNMEWAKNTYNDQYEKWMPWVEDMYLKWFTKDNKASYATKGLFHLLKEKNHN